MRCAPVVKWCLTMPLGLLGTALVVLSLVVVDFGATNCQQIADATDIETFTTEPTQGTGSFGTTLLPNVTRGEDRDRSENKDAIDGPIGPSETLTVASDLQPFTNDYDDLASVESIFGSQAGNVDGLTDVTEIFADGETPNDVSLTTEGSSKIGRDKGVDNESYSEVTTSATSLSGYRDNDDINTPVDEFVKLTTSVNRGDSFTTAENGDVKEHNVGSQSLGARDERGKIEDNEEIYGEEIIDNKNFGDYRSEYYDWATENDRGGARDVNYLTGDIVTEESTVNYKSDSNDNSNLDDRIEESIDNAAPKNTQESTEVETTTNDINNGHTQQEIHVTTQMSSILTELTGGIVTSEESTNELTVVIINDDILKNVMLQSNADSNTAKVAPIEVTTTEIVPNSKVESAEINIERTFASTLATVDDADVDDVTTDLVTPTYTNEVDSRNIGKSTDITAGGFTNDLATTQAITNEKMMSTLSVVTEDVYDDISDLSSTVTFQESPESTVAEITDNMKYENDVTTQIASKLATSEEIANATTTSVMNNNVEHVEPTTKDVTGTVAPTKEISNEVNENEFESIVDSAWSTIAEDTTADDVDEASTEFALLNYTKETSELHTRIIQSTVPDVTTNKAITNEKFESTTFIVTNDIYDDILFESTGQTSEKTTNYVTKSEYESTVTKINTKPNAESTITSVTTGEVINEETINETTPIDVYDKLFKFTAPDNSMSTGSIEALEETTIVVTEFESTATKINTTPNSDFEQETEYIVKGTNDAESTVMNVVGEVAKEEIVNETTTQFESTSPKIIYDDNLFASTAQDNFKSTVTIRWEDINEQIANTETSVPEIKIDKDITTEIASKLIGVACGKTTNDANFMSTAVKMNDDISNNLNQQYNSVSTTDESTAAFITSEETTNEVTINEFESTLTKINTTPIDDEQKFAPTMAKDINDVDEVTMVTTPNYTNKMNTLSILESTVEDTDEDTANDAVTNDQFESATPIVVTNDQFESATPIVVYDDILFEDTSIVTIREGAINVTPKEVFGSTVSEITDDFNDNMIQRKNVTQGAKLTDVTLPVTNEEMNESTIDKIESTTPTTINDFDILFEVFEDDSTTREKFMTSTKIFESTLDGVTTDDFDAVYMNQKDDVTTPYSKLTDHIGGARDVHIVNEATTNEKFQSTTPVLSDISDIYDDILFEENEGKSTAHVTTGQDVEIQQTTQSTIANEFENNFITESTISGSTTEFLKLNDDVVVMHLLFPKSTSQKNKEVTTTTSTEVTTETKFEVTTVTEKIGIEDEVTTELVVEGTTDLAIEETSESVIELHTTNDKEETVPYITEVAIKNNDDDEGPTTPTVTTKFTNGSSIIDSSTQSASQTNHKSSILLTTDETSDSTTAETTKENDENTDDLISSEHGKDENTLNTSETSESTIMDLEQSEETMEVITEERFKPILSTSKGDDDEVNISDDTNEVTTPSVFESVVSNEINTKVALTNDVLTLLNGEDNRATILNNWGSNISGDSEDIREEAGSEATEDNFVPTADKITTDHHNTEATIELSSSMDSGGNLRDSVRHIKYFPTEEDTIDDMNKMDVLSEELNSKDTSEHTNENSSETVTILEVAGDDNALNLNSIISVEDLQKEVTTQFGNEIINNQSEATTISGKIVNTAVESIDFKAVSEDDESKSIEESKEEINNGNLETINTNDEILKGTTMENSLWSYMDLQSVNEKFKEISTIQVGLINDDTTFAYEELYTASTINRNIEEHTIKTITTNVVKEYEDKVTQINLKSTVIANEASTEGVRANEEDSQSIFQHIVKENSHENKSNIDEAVKQNVDRHYTSLEPTPKEYTTEMPSGVYANNITANGKFSDGENINVLDDEKHEDISIQNQISIVPNPVDETRNTNDTKGLSKESSEETSGEDNQGEASRKTFIQIDGKNNVLDGRDKFNLDVEDEGSGVLGDVAKSSSEEEMHADGLEIPKILQNGRNMQLKSNDGVFEESSNEPNQGERNATQNGGMKLQNNETTSNENENLEDTESKESFKEISQRVFKQYIDVASNTSNLGSIEQAEERRTTPKFVEETNLEEFRGKIDGGILGTVWPTITTTLDEFGSIKIGNQETTPVQDFVNLGDISSSTETYEATYNDEISNENHKLHDNDAALTYKLTSSTHIADQKKYGNFNDTDELSFGRVKVEIIDDNRDVRLSGNMSMKLTFQDSDIIVPKTARTFGNCSPQGCTLKMTWGARNAGGPNNTIHVAIAIDDEIYYINAIRLIILRNGLHKSDETNKFSNLTLDLNATNLELLKTALKDTMRGYHTVDLDGAQLQLVDVNLKLSLNSTDLGHLRKEESKSANDMALLITGACVGVALVIGVVAFVLFRKYRGNATIYKMTIE